MEIRFKDPNQFAKAKELSLTFNIPFQFDNKSEERVENNESYKNDEGDNINYIELSGEKTFLVQRDIESKNELRLEINLSSGAYNRKFTSPKKELLGRALGWSQGYRKVLDLTAGLGVDTIFISQMGFEVIAIERNPALALLLSQALLKIPNDSIRFYFSEAKSFLMGLGINELPEVIYYDPMYPSTKKSALPNKNMQVLRQMIGEDEADSDLLRLAISKCTQRVVVKRPLGAPAIIAKPTSQLEGKLVRYDLYKRDCF